MTEKQENETFTVSKNQLVLLALAAFFVLGALQAWQLSSTIAALNSGQVPAGLATATTTATASPASNPAPSQSGLPDSLANLPTQVGGC